MLTSRGQENVVHTRPTAGKALLPKTPSNFQTPRITNRAPLGAKTTNAKAPTALKDKQNAKLQPFKTPAPGQQIVKPERITTRPSTTRKSGRSKITIAFTESIKTDVLVSNPEDDEPEFGYAPPPPTELPDPPIEFGYDQTFPQFRPENMFRGYGEIYLSSPKDEHGFSIRLKRQEEEWRKRQEEDEQNLTKRIEEDLAKPLFISDDEFDVPKQKVRESKPDTIRSQSAALALSGIRLPSVANKQTASSRLKANKPVQHKVSAMSTKNSLSIRPKPLAVSKNTIGFPKAKKAPSIIPLVDILPEDDRMDTDSLIDEFSDFEFFPSSSDNYGEDVFQLPVPE